MQESVDAVRGFSFVFSLCFLIQMTSGGTSSYMNPHAARLAAAPGETRFVTRVPRNTFVLQIELNRYCSIEHEILLSQCKMKIDLMFSRLCHQYAALKTWDII